jgi:D-alanine--poly(phosphoribitol) ligase subunit 1
MTLDQGKSPTDPDVLQAWRAAALATPEDPAAKDGARSLSNQELHDEVKSVVAGLIARGVRRGDRVALHIPNSVDFAVATFACLWVGAMFIPLAATDPPARVSSIVDDCAPVLILTAVGVAEPHPDAVMIDATAMPNTIVPAPVTDIDLPAYAIYTSGTTGAPKGVVISRGAFAAAAASIISHLGLTQQTRTLCVSPFHFDGSFATLFPTLAVGGSVVIPPRESLLFARFFVGTVARENITYTGFSSSYLRLLLADPRRERLAETSLGIIALGGEVCSAPDVADLWSYAPKIRVFNRYGPTETTIAVTHFEVTREVITRGAAVPIGKPHDGVTFHLIDGAGNEISEPDEVGELYIGGRQLMDGYWGAPALTATVLTNTTVPGMTTYRTGDVMTRAKTGDYVYVDRADRVVKRNAVRISLVELADVLREIPGVTASTCVAYNNEGQLGIAGFVVAQGRNTLELRQAAGERLPSTMLPDVMTIVDDLPMTSSSKVDERRLLLDAGLRGL